MLGRKKPRLIDEWHVDSSEHWVAIPLAPTPGWEFALASSLTQDLERQRLIAEHAVDIQTELVQRPGMWLGFAAWVPDLDQPWLVAALSVEITVFEGQGNRDVLRADWDGEAPPGFELQQQSMTNLDLADGPALRRTEIVSQITTGEIEERLTYTVFPTGAQEALQLTFACAQLQYGERLLDEADAIVNSLTMKTV